MSKLEELETIWQKAVLDHTAAQDARDGLHATQQEELAQIVLDREAFIAQKNAYAKKAIEKGYRHAKPSPSAITEEGLAIRATIIEAREDRLGEMDTSLGLLAQDVRRCEEAVAGEKAHLLARQEVTLIEEFLSLHKARIAIQASIRSEFWPPQPEVAFDLGEGDMIAAFGMLIALSARRGDARRNHDAAELRSGVLSGSDA